MIEARDIVKDYGSKEAKVTALRGVSLAISAGEFVAVMGESGSGKSTLLSVLGTLNRPTAGKLFLGGVDVYAQKERSLADLRRVTIGFVFQNFNLIPYLTLLENVMLPLAVSPLAKAAKSELAREALCKVGLAGKAGRLPGQISGGEQERTAIARAIVNGPPLLLADEPTGNLDSRTGREVMAVLANLNAAGMTVVMVTHNASYAAMAGRLLRLSDGMLIPS